MLRAALAKRLGRFQLDVTLAVEPGRTLVLVGESGCGKTVTLRLLAGILEPDRGRIELDGETWFDGESGVRVPADRRGVGYVPQDYALFPHLSAGENVAFGLRARGVRGQALRARVREALERFSISDLAGRRPGALSGGQQQRVALARALVLEPRLLLLDEPLASLDESTAERVRGELAALLRQLACATVLVTHRAEEARLFGDEVLTLANGRLSGS